MRLTEVQALLARISYQPGYEFRAHVPAWGGQVEWLQVRFWRPDRATGVEGWGYSRRYGLTPDATPGNVVTTVFAALRDLATHEAAEAFLVDQVAIFNHHFDLDAMIAAQRSEA